MSAASGRFRRLKPGARSLPQAALLAATVGLAGALALQPRAAEAGTVYLLNNEEIDGEILDVGVDFVVIKVPGGKQSIPLREVRDVEFRPGESLWEKKLKDALQRAKEARAAELAAKRASQQPRVIAPRPGPMPPPTAGDPIPLPIVPDTPHFDPTRLGAFYESERYQFQLRYPSGMQPAEPEEAFVTFRDGGGAVTWSFNVTYFDISMDVDYDLIRSKAQAELERIPHYRARSRRPFSIGRYAAERTTGSYERGSRSIRHDQVVVPTRRGVLLIHFFSPGATMEENSVPDVDGVISSLEVK